MSCAVFEDADSTFGEGIPIPHKNTQHFHKHQPNKNYQSSALQIKSGSSFQNKKRNEKLASCAAQYDNYFERLSKENSRAFDKKDLDLSKCEKELLRRKKRENKLSEDVVDNEKSHLEQSFSGDNKVRKSVRKVGNEFGQYEKEIKPTGKEISKPFEINSAASDNLCAKKFKNKKQETVILTLTPPIDISRDNLTDDLNQLPGRIEKQTKSKISKKEIKSENGGEHQQQSNTEKKHKTIPIKTEQISDATSKKRFLKNDSENDSIVSQVTPVIPDKPVLVTPVIPDKPVITSQLDYNKKIKKEPKTKIQISEIKGNCFTPESKIAMTNKNTTDNKESDSEILRLQQKMGKLQNKITSMQRKVLRLQGSLKQR